MPFASPSDTLQISDVLKEVKNDVAWVIVIVGSAHLEADPDKKDGWKPLQNGKSPNVSDIKTYNVV